MNWKQAVFAIILGASAFFGLVEIISVTAPVSFWLALAVVSICLGIVGLILLAVVGIVLAFEWLGEH